MRKARRRPRCARMQLCGVTQPPCQGRSCLAKGYRLPTLAHEPRRPAFPSSQKVPCFAYAARERGGPTNLAVEIVSPNEDAEKGEDWSDKLAKYFECAVSEAVRFDPPRPRAHGCACGTESTTTWSSAW